MAVNGNAFPIDSPKEYTGTDLIRQFIIACLLLTVCLPVAAQSKRTSARLAAERKKQAQLLLITLASEARSFQDLKLRARSLARIADALWEADSEQSRSLFIKSWEAAGSADADDSHPQELGEGPSNVRKEVLVLIAKRDRVLAEELLEKLKVEQAANPRPDLQADDYWHLSDALQQRLDLANELLSTGDTKRALEIADPVLSRPAISTLDFLTALREKDPAAADERYARMIRQTSANQRADANTVSLLASYIFTPRMYVLFNSQGAADASWSETQLPPANVSPQLKLMFFQTGSDVLLRPLPAPDQDQSSVAIRYAVIRRLLPLFEHDAPGSLTDAVRTELQTLTTLVSESVRDADKEWSERGITPEKTAAEQEQPLLDQVERVNSSDERDAIYFKLACLAVSRDDPNARDYVDKIAFTELRKQARRWVDWALTERAVRQKKVDAALELVRTADLSHIQRVWILTQSAKLIVSKDRERAVALVDEATAAARRSDSSEDRARGLLAVANALLIVQPARVGETLFEAVKAANSAESFTGEDATLPLTINTTQQIMKTVHHIPEFDIEPTFSELAKKNFDRAVQLAHGFEREAARTNATIAICRPILNAKSTTSGNTRDSAARN